MAIEQSAYQYNNPDSLLGYGIPDFELADKYLKVNSARYLNWESSWAVSPNPFTDYLFIQNLNPVSSETCLIKIYNLQGVCLLQSTQKTSETTLLRNLTNLPDCFLVLTIRSGEKEEQFKLIKVNQQNP